MRKAHAADLDVCLPELVLREVIESWLRDLRAERQRLADQVNAFNRDTFGLAKMKPPFRLPEAGELRALLRRNTKDITDQFRSVITRDRLASEYTELALQRHGAFGDKGKGFHDTIILLGIIEDMTERKYTRAIIVSADGDFRLDGVKQLAYKANVALTILTSLAALETEVNDALGAKLVREMNAAKQYVIDMVKTREVSLVDFLGKTLDYTRDPLGPFFNTVSRREFLSFVGINDAHSSEVLFKPGPRKDFKFSVDVRVNVRERSEEYRVSDPLSGFSVESLFQVVHPEGFVSKVNERVMAVTVEGEADISDKGVETIRFTSIRDTKTGGGFASLIAGA